MPGSTIREEGYHATDNAYNLGLAVEVKALDNRLDAPPG